MFVIALTVNYLLVDCDPSHTFILTVDQSQAWGRGRRLVRQEEGAGQVTRRRPGPPSSPTLRSGRVPGAPATTPGCQTTVGALTRSAALVRMSATSERCTTSKNQRTGNRILISRDNFLMTNDALSGS